MLRAKTRHKSWFAMKKTIAILAGVLLVYFAYKKVAATTTSNAGSAAQDASSETYDAASGLRGMVSAIPVYLPSKVTSRITGGDLSGKLSSFTWFLDTPSKKEDVIAFYQKQLPNAAKTPYNDGSVMWDFTPAGGQEAANEDATVLITAEGKIEITESVLKERRSKAESANPDRGHS